MGTAARCMVKEVVAVHVEKKVDVEFRKLDREWTTEDDRVDPTKIFERAMEGRQVQKRREKAFAVDLGTFEQKGAIA